MRPLTIRPVTVRPVTVRPVIVRKFAIALLSAPVRAYRFLLSPLMPRSCRFTPSCSVYALQALDQHGPVKGLWLTVRRLARCHPITWLGGSSGFDPVPFSKRHPKGYL